MLLDVSTKFFCKDLLTCKENEKEGEQLTQQELRNLLCERVKREKQCYIAEVTNIHPRVLSQFKNGKLDLYEHLFKRLEIYLNN